MIRAINETRRGDPLPTMLRCVFILLLWFVGIVSTAQAQVQPVTVRVPNETAWVGQRVPFFVELRANGSFDGTASFDLPQLPGSIMIKIGTPVVSSEEIDGTTWFVQTHEFALFSQQAGEVQIPEFAVRFAHRDGFVGVAKDQQGLVPEFAVKVQRPPGTENIGFLITTESYELEEDWNPQPGPAQVGDVFRRTIRQRAGQISGMALAPASTKVPDGIRVYPSDAQTQDQIQRGEFVGNRSEIITYLLTQPGMVTLPAVTYVWWNPDVELIQSKTLPSQTFEVSPAPSEAPSVDSAAAGQSTSGRIGFLLALAFAIAMIIFQRHRIASWLRTLWSRLNPPDRVAARALLVACRRNDAVAAERAWTMWRNTRSYEFRPAGDLRVAVFDLESHLYSHDPKGNWEGAQLHRAFRNHLKIKRQTPLASTTTRHLNPLNP